MRIQNQVCTLEQAKRLKELGIKQGALWYYYETIINSVPEIKLFPAYYEENGSLQHTECLWRAVVGESNNECYPAYNVAELGIMLPTHAPSVGRTITRTEAINRASVVIQMLEKNYVTAAEINERLKIS